MALLSSLAKTFKDKMASLGTEAGNFKAALKDTASKYGDQQGFIANVGSIGAKGLAAGADLLSGDVKGALGDIGITKENIQAAGDYIKASPSLSEMASPDWKTGLIATPRAIQEELIPAVGNTIGGLFPATDDLMDDGRLNFSAGQGDATDIGTTISKGITGGLQAINVPANVIASGKDTTKSYTDYYDAIQSGDYNKAARSFADTLIGGGKTVLSALPGYQAIKGVTGTVMGATGADKSLAQGQEKFTDIVGDIGADFGLDKQKTKDWTNTVVNGLSTGMQLYAGTKYNPLGREAVAAKLRIADPLKVTASQIVGENVKQALKGAAVGSSVDQFVMMFDDGEGRDKAINSAATMLTSALMPGAFGGIKGRPTKSSLSKLAEDNTAQTKMDVTPTTPKGVAETIADYVPVEKVNPESAIVTPNKLLSDLAKEQDTALNTNRATGEKGPLQSAMDNIARYEDYVANIKSTGKMPSGKNATKKDYDFMKAEYRRLTDIKNNVGKTPDTELVDLGGGKGTLVREKILALPEPKEALIAREQAKRDAYLSDLESKKSEADSQEALVILSKEFDDYNSKIETESNIGQAGRDRDAYLSDLEQQRVDYANQQELDTDNQRLAGEFDQYRGYQINSQLESNAIMNNPKVTPLSKFTDTNPTVGQAIVAELARKAMNEGRSPNTIFEQSNLTSEQKKLIIEEYQADVIYNQTNPKTLSDIAKEQKANGDAPDIEMKGGNAPGAGSLYEAAIQSTIKDPTVEMKQEKGAKARGIINANINLQGFLNNLLFKGSDGRVVSGDSYLEQSRGVANSVARKIIEPMENLLLDITNNKRFGNKKVSIDPKDLIGGKTYEGIDITTDNYKKVADTYDNISGQNIGQKHTILENDPRVALQQKSFLYDVLKGDQKKLDKYLTADEQATLAKVDQLEKETYTKYAQDLVDQGYISDIDVANEYVRYVMGKKNYDRAVSDMNLKNQPLQVKLADGKSYRTFDNIDELMQFYQYNNSRIKHGKTSEIHPDEANLASVLKEKAEKQFDIYRTHGSVNRLMSYGESVGKLYGDRFKSELFESIAKSDDPNVRAYSDQLFMSPNHQNVVQEAYGIKQPDTLLKKAGRIGTISAIYGNIKPLVSAVTSSVPKTASVLITNLLDSKGDPSQMLAGIRSMILKSQNVKNTLASEGFTTGYELGGDMGSTNKVMAWSSGVPAENAAKSVIAVSGMASQLKKNGIKTSTDPEDIVKAWGQFKKDEPAKYRQAHESVLKNTRLISDVSDSAKLQTAYVRDYLGPVKTYVIQQTKSGFDDIVDSLTLSLRKKEGYKNIQEDALKRTVARGLAAAGGYALSQLFADDTENQELRDEKQYWINSDFFYNPYELLKSSFGLNGISTVPLNMVSDIVQSLSDLRNPPLAARTLIRGLSQNIGAVRTVDNVSREVTGKPLSEWVLGYDPSNMTEAGLSKGNEYSTGTVAKMLRASGFNENYREEQFARDNLDEIIPKEWVAKTMADTFLRQFPFVQQTNDVMTNLSTFDARVKGLNAYNTAKQIDGATTLGEALEKSGLDKGIQDQISRRINETMNTIMKGNTDIKAAYGKDFDLLNNKGLEMPIDRLKNVDPVMYNNIVSIIATAQAEDKNQSNAVDAWKSYTPQEAGMIAQYQKAAPLETSLSNEVGKRIKTAYSTIDDVTIKDASGKNITGFIPGGKEKLDEELGKVNKMAEFFASVRDDMGAHEKGVSLHANDIQGKLNSIKELQIQGLIPPNYLDSFPFLRTLVKNGLQLKGEEITPTTGTTTDLQVPQASAKKGLSGMIGAGAVGAKPLKWKNLEYDEKKFDTLINSKREPTLSEILKSQSKKLPTTSGRKTK